MIYVTWEDKDKDINVISFLDLDEAKEFCNENNIDMDKNCYCLDW